MRLHELDINIRIRANQTLRTKTEKYPPTKQWQKATHRNRNRICGNTLV